MNKQYGLIVSCCIFVLVFMFGFSAAYARDSINTFKSVANEAEEIRSQYKERQNYLQEKKNLKQAKDTVDAYNKELAGNRDEISKVKKKRISIRNLCKIQESLHILPVGGVVLVALIFFFIQIVFNIPL